MPTFTASTPRADEVARVPSAVATLPATTSTDGNSSAGRDRLEDACGVAVRRVDHEDVHVRLDQRAAAAPASRCATPTAAPTRRRPSESLQAFGYLICFWMSLTVMRPCRLKSRVDDEQLLDLVLVEDLLAPARASCPRAP